jgi:ferritin-like metal-binding protein YciE
MIPDNMETEVFVALLQTLWSAEKQLTEAMPLMIEKATNLGLQKNLAMHLAETDQHKVAIEAICKQLGYDHQGEENADLKALLEEGQRSMSAAAVGEALDAAIIKAAIAIEHYEIGAYEEAGNTAESLGYEGVAQRLRMTLEEERQADAKLNFLDKFFRQQSSALGAPGLALK